MKFKLDGKIIFTDKKSAVECNPDDKGFYETNNKNTIKLLEKRGHKEYKETKKTKKEVNTNE